MKEQTPRRIKEQTNRDEQYNNWYEKYSRVISSIFDDTEEQISKLGERVVEII